MLLNRKLILLIACVCLFFSIVTLQDTYAKYTSAVNETTDISIARWRILVNDFDIRNNSSTTNLIEPDFDGNSNIAADVIAPTAQGSFTVVVDATGTDLAFNYSINVANSVNSPVSDIRVLRATLNGTAVNVTNNALNDSTISGTIGLSDQRVNTFIVYIEWFDGNGENMNNAADTATTLIQDGAAQLSVTINFTQVPTATPTPTPTATPAPTSSPEPDPEP